MYKEKYQIYEEFWLLCDTEMNLRYTLEEISYSFPYYVPFSIPLIIVLSYPVPVRNSKWGIAFDVRVLYVAPAFIFGSYQSKMVCVCARVHANRFLGSPYNVAAFVSHVNSVSQHLVLTSSSFLPSHTILNCTILCDTTLKRFPKRSSA